MKKTPQNNAAFTVIELAISLTIIALIMVGVFAGQEILKSSKHNSLIADIRSYEAANNTFELKYDSVPGDMRNATDYWGEDSDTTPCPDADVGDGTCDGNGNGKVDNLEAGRVWQQLSLSEIIKADYTFDSAVIIGTNFPETSFDDTTISLGYSGFWNDGFLPNAAKNKNVLCTNGVSYGSGDPCSSPVGSAILADDALAIDLKIDDGKPYDGYLIASACIDSANREFEEFGLINIGDTYDYDFAGGKSCGLMFIPKNQK